MSVVQLLLLLNYGVQILSGLFKALDRIFLLGPVLNLGRSALSTLFIPTSGHSSNLVLASWGSLGSPIGIGRNVLEGNLLLIHFEALISLLVSPDGLRLFVGFCLGFCLTFDILMVGSESPHRNGRSHGLHPHERDLPVFSRNARSSEGLEHRNELVSCVQDGGLGLSGINDTPL